LFAEATRACVVVSWSALGEEVGGAAFEVEMERAIARHSAASWYGEAREIWDQWTGRVLATDDPREVEYMLGKVAPFYVADPEAPRVRAHLDHLAENARVDLAAVKAWESGLYQGIDLRPILPLVQCRTLVIAGAADVACGPAHARAIVKHLPHAELVVIRECGHSPQVETPDVFRKTMLRWTADAH
jgi:pimeloyl-ACP methyl ester carboxylesterase